MRKGCEGTVASAGFDENTKKFITACQDEALKAGAPLGNDFDTKISTIGEYAFKIDRPAEVFSRFLDQVRRYLFFEECEVFRRKLEEEAGIKPEFAAKLAELRPDFCPMRVQMRFPSASTSFSEPKLRGHWLLARGDDGLVRIWKQDAEHGWLLLNEVGMEGAGQGPFDLCGEDWLFYAHKKQLCIYFWKNGRLIRQEASDMPVTDITADDNDEGVIVSFDKTGALKMTVENNKPVSGMMCRPPVVDRHFTFLELLLRAGVIHVDGTAWFVPDTRTGKKNDISIDGKNLSERTKKLLSGFFNEENGKFVKKNTRSMRELLVHICASKKAAILDHVAKGLVPISRNPEVSIAGIERFDSYLAIGFSEKQIRIYNRQGRKKLAFMLNSIAPDEFRKPVRDIELRVFDDGYLMKSGERAFYGSENWRDYIYVTDGHDIYMPDAEGYSEYFDYICQESLFDRIVDGEWKEKEPTTGVKDKGAGAKGLVIRSQGLFDVIELRSKAIAVTDNQRFQKFGLDEKGRPKKYVKNSFKDNGDGTITDQATGLVWRKRLSGSYTFAKAKKHIDELNSNGFGGRRNWRIPTVGELLGLYEPEIGGKTGLYISTFLSEKSSLLRELLRYAPCWSCDMRKPSGVWCVALNKSAPLLWRKKISRISLLPVCDW